MKKIEQFTDAQWAEVHAAREKWLAIGRSTASVDRAEVERHISTLYRKAGKEPPWTP